MAYIPLNDARGYMQGMDELSRDLYHERNGFVEIELETDDGNARILMRRSNLYVAAFFSERANAWYRFTDEVLPAEYHAIDLGFDGNYNSLGDLDFTITRRSMTSLVCLSKYNPSAVGSTDEVKKALRLAAVSIAEGLRFASVRTRIMSVLQYFNGQVIRESFDVIQLEREIRSWAAGSAARLPGILIPHIAND